MNKMTKGAIATGLGVALLLGGGGTLAVWNAGAEGSAGTITSGDLNLHAEAGQWQSNISGVIGDINEYRVVPGETLTYTQDLAVTLDGDNLQATLTVTGAGQNNGFNPNFVTVSEPLLQNSAGTVVATTVLDEQSPEDITATITFAFSADTPARDSVNATYDFSNVGFVLEQQAPQAG